MVIVNSMHAVLRTAALSLRRVYMANGRAIISQKRSIGASSQDLIEGPLLSTLSPDSAFRPRTPPRIVSHGYSRLQSVSRIIETIYPCRRNDNKRWFSTSGSSSSNSNSNNDTATWNEKVSPRDMANLEEQVFKQIAEKVQDPVLQQPLSKLQWLHKRIAVSNGDQPITTLQLLLRLPSLLHPSLDELKERIRTEANAAVQEWLNKRENQPSLAGLNVQVNVEAIATTPVPMMARLVDDHEDLLKELGPGLETVSHFVAVYSCKGGVGKSTVAVNLAYELAAQGGRVGLLDLDLYGPSLPVLIQPEDVTIRRSPLGPGAVFPIEHGNVKLLSLGYVNTHSGVPGSGQDNGAAIMKGPMAVKVVSQLLKGTDWGDLDVLILDLPPGTGDVQLAVLQQLQLSGAIAVTTPSKLATADTRKGIEMFTSLGVPTLAVVENLAYFDDDTGQRHFPFGEGFAKDQSMLPNAEKSSLVQLPISVTMNDSVDDASPLTHGRPEGAEKLLAAFHELSDIVARELLLLQYGAPTEDHEHVIFDDETNLFNLATVTISLDKAKDKFAVRLFSDTGVVQKNISPAQLRSRDPKTGDLLPDSPHLDQEGAGSEQQAEASHPMVTRTRATRKRSPSVIPTKVERRGRYGFAVEWGDGATIIYSLKCLAKAAGGEVTDSKR